MCKIHLIHSPEPLRTTELNVIDKLMNWASYGNKDGYGVFYKGKTSGLVKEPISYRDVVESDKNKLWSEIHKAEATTVIAHNRLSTSGENTEDNTHPFESKHFVLVHNGIITNAEELKKGHKLNYKPKVDSYAILALLEKYYTDYTGAMAKEHEDAMNDAIVEVAEKLKGSYSVIVFEKATEDVYYFKSESTDFSWYLINDKVILGTTTDTYAKEAMSIPFMIFKKNLFKKVRKVTAEDGIIYKLSNGTIETVGTFHENYKSSGLWGRDGAWNSSEDYAITGCSKTACEETPDNDGYSKEIAAYLETYCDIIKANVSISKEFVWVNALTANEANSLLYWFGEDFCQSFNCSGKLRSVRIDKCAVIASVEEDDGGNESAKLC